MNRGAGDQAGPILYQHRSKEVTISLVVITDGSRLDSLRRAIESAKPVVQEVVVVYQGYDAAVKAEIDTLCDFCVSVSYKGNADPDRNFAYTLVSKDWILALDDDEYLPAETQGFIERIVNSPVDVVWFNFDNRIDGVDMIDILGPDPHPRLWRKRDGLIMWPDRAHTFPQITSELQYVSGDAKIVHDRKYEDVLKRHEARSKNIDPQMAELEKRFINAVQSKLGRK